MNALSKFGAVGLLIISALFGLVIFLGGKTSGIRYTGAVVMGISLISILLFFG